jgi:O-antigen/teichoic acid export membrane protein
MSRAEKTARGVMWNWIALGFGFCVTFFMSPFIVHRLGLVTYGVWGLVVSITSYMGLLDLGLRGAVIRFVSSNHALGNHAEASRAVSGALWLRQWIGLTVFVLCFSFAFLVSRFFAIPAEVQHAARWAIVLSGLGVGLTLYFGVFTGVLAALHRFDLMSEISIAQTILRAAGVVWVLRSGFGILGLASWELSLAIVIGLTQTYMCFASYPELHVSVKFPGTDILKAFAGYSGWVLLVHIFGQVIYYTDNLVVGAFVSVAAVAFYTIGGSLIEYLRTVVASLTTTFMPLASNYEAAGENDKLRLLLINGTRLALLVALPIQIALFFRGETFLNFWMGPQYGPTSGRVLRILLVGQVFTLANATSMNITFGLAKHKRFAIWLGGEALANIAISIFLARRIGIYGVAIGTVIPTLFVQIVLWPRYISQIVGVHLKRYLFQAWVRPLLAVIPFGIACYFSDRYWPAAGLIGFFSQIAATLPVYLLFVALSFWKDIAQLLKLRTKWISWYSRA